MLGRRDQGNEIAHDAGSAILSYNEEKLKISCSPEQIRDRVGIEQRRDHIKDRSEHGHWEADTTVSSKSAVALMVLLERSLGLTLLR